MAKKAPKKTPTKKSNTTCKYCGKPADPFILSINLGACNKDKCKLASMRDHL